MEVRSLDYFIDGPIPEEARARIPYRLAPDAQVGDVGTLHGSESARRFEVVAFARDNRGSQFVVIEYKDDDS